MENETSSVHRVLIWERIFKTEEEPTGVRVTPYHKPCAIRQILNALDPDEVEHIQNSPFRKLQIQNSPFGKLVEIADKPSFFERFGCYIIFRQLNVAKKHYAWFVFARKPIRFSMREFTFVTGLNCGKIQKRSKKRAMKNNITEKPYWNELFGTLKEVPVASVIRMLQKKTLSSVILPTTHTPRISQDHAEMIKDIEEFFEYPWGGVSFNMLISSIKESKEVSLSQNTIALKGFVLSLQQVMVEAVPALTEAIVHSIIFGGDNLVNAGTEFDWPDDKEDSSVGNLLKLIEQHYPFSYSFFTHGVTKLDVIRLCEKAKAGGLHHKTTKAKQDTSTQIPVGFDVEFVADAVKDKLKEDFRRLETRLATLRENEWEFPTIIEEAVRFINHVSSSSADVGNGREDGEGDGYGVANVQNVGTSRMEACVVIDEVDNATVGGGDEACDDANITDIHLGADEVALGCRKIVERLNPLSAKVVDLLSSHISALYRGNSHRKHQSKCVFVDTQFVSQISKVYTKFSKVLNKESFRFPDNIFENIAFVEAEHFYFPFNLDKKYWVGICIDMSTWFIVVLDSNLPKMSDYMLSKEVRPIAQMFPYFAKQAPLFTKNNAITDSAVSTIFFIQAHAVAGVDASKCITTAVLDTEVERLVVILYEGNVGPF
ncbi:hypothetical protein N665_0421s0019 [Sinapis alba]|nr:hypothetical protein N665_0421s0019 [Sinapis alba]